MASFLNEDSYLRPDGIKSSRMRLDSNYVTANDGYQLWAQLKMTLEPWEK